MLRYDQERCGSRFSSIFVRSPSRNPEVKDPRKKEREKNGATTDRDSYIPRAIVAVIFLAKISTTSETKGD